jgi:hypothetical protein
MRLAYAAASAMVLFVAACRRVVRQAADCRLRQASVDGRVVGIRFTHNVEAVISGLAMTKG